MNNKPQVVHRTVLELLIGRSEQGIIDGKVVRTNDPRFAFRIDTIVDGQPVTVAQIARERNPPTEWYLVSFPRVRGKEAQKQSACVQSAFAAQEEVERNHGYLPSPYYVLF